MWNCQQRDVWATEALYLGSTAWEDEVTVQWPIVNQETQVLGCVSVEIDACVTGPVPYAETSLLVFPIPPLVLQGRGHARYRQGRSMMEPIILAEEQGGQHMDHP